MEDNSKLALWVLAWAVVLAIIIASRWRKGAKGVGLSFAFLMHLWLIHWPAAVVYLLPWYLEFTDINNESIVGAGFRQSAYAIMGFGVGSVILFPIVMGLLRRPGRVATVRLPAGDFAKRYIILGLLSFVALRSPIGRLPTLNALLGVGMNLLVVGLGLVCWEAWQAKRYRSFVSWMLLTFSLPLFTIIILGFAGMGMMIFLFLFAFVSNFVRPRWKLIAVGLLLSYLGVSFYATYTRDRDLIREVVWNEESTWEERIDRVSLTFSSIEWFDPFNPVHLFYIDRRLNMNEQVGEAVDYIASGYREYAYGGTIWQSIIGLIPRVVWPEKPLVAGGSELAAYYTGIEFAEGTSVGFGLVTEFFVNFGTVGVFLGFLCLGILVTAVDSAAGERLVAGDWQGFALWFLPGIALLNVGGSLVEVTSGAGAAVVTALLVNRYLVRLFQSKKPATPFNKAVGKTVQSLQP